MYFVSRTLLPLRARSLRGEDRCGLASWKYGGCSEEKSIRREVAPVAELLQPSVPQVSAQSSGRRDVASKEARIYVRIFPYSRGPRLSRILPQNSCTSVKVYWDQTCEIGRTHIVRETPIGDFQAVMRGLNLGNRPSGRLCVAEMIPTPEPRWKNATRTAPRALCARLINVSQ
jgi:hypothetical protein